MERQSLEFEEEPRSYMEILEKFARCFDMKLRFYKNPSSKFLSGLRQIKLKTDQQVKYLTYVCLEKVIGKEKEPSKKSGEDNNRTMMTLTFHHGTFWFWTAGGKDCEEASKNYVEGLILDESFEAMTVYSRTLVIEDISKSFPRSSLEELMVFLDLHSQTV